MKLPARTFLGLACRFFGFDPKLAWMNITRAPTFARQLYQYQHLNTDSTLRARLTEMRPILHESQQEAGIRDWVYFQQDLWAAKKIFCRRPSSHVDIGSRVDGFISHLLVFMPVCLVDARPLRRDVRGLTTLTGDATYLSMFKDCSLQSVSSLHAAEHFGLGRYSDPINPDAWRRFAIALQRVLAPGGRLYFSVPLGRQRVEFNAHRVFAARTILDIFGNLDLASFSFVDRGGRLHEDAPVEQLGDCEAGAGLFEFAKPGNVDHKQEIGRAEFPFAYSNQVSGVD